MVFGGGLLVGGDGVLFCLYCVGFGVYVVCVF